LLRKRFWWTKDEEKAATIKNDPQSQWRNTFEYLLSFFLLLSVSRVKQLQLLQTAMAINCCEAVDSSFTAPSSALVFLASFTGTGGC